MAVEVILPRRGNSVETCLILEWKKSEGEAVQAGDVLVEMETDKATFEIESPVNGTLLKTFYPVGEDAPVLSLLALVGAEGEDVSSYAAVPSPPPAATVIEDAVESAIAPLQKAAEAYKSPSTPSGKSAISPRARKLAERKGIAYQRLDGSGPGGRIIERDIRKAIQIGEPLTQAAAVAVAADSSTVIPAAGSALGGMIRTADLKRGDEVPGGTAIPVTGIRAIIAERMHLSLQSTAQFTLNRSADAQNLLDLRRRIKSSPETLGLADVTVDKMILFATAQLLRRVPELNSHFFCDRILQFSEVHLGYAVDTPRGLMVPVIRSADSLSLRQIAGEARRLQTACLEGKILPEELSGGTFTVSNLGMLGIESFTPVLNMPEVGILGVGGIELKAVRRDGEIVFRDHLSLSLTVNHQAVDGGPAARFLTELSAFLTDFDLFLASSGENR